MTSPTEFSIDKTASDLEIIKSILEQLLDKEVNEDCKFNIAIRNNEEDFNLDNLIKDDQVMGVLTPNITNIPSGGAGAENKELNVKFLIELNEDNSRYNTAITNVARFINNKEFDIDENEGSSLIVNNVTIGSGQKLDTAIRGKEYEEVNLIFTLLTTKSFMRSDVEYLEFQNDDGTADRLDGIFNITTEVRKSADSATIGLDKPQTLVTPTIVQTSIIAEYFAFKKNKLHARINNESKKPIIYSITHNDGFQTEKLNMYVSEYLVSSLVGDVKKIKLTLVETINL